MRMFIMSARVEIIIYESQSLKEKRKIIKSLVTKIRNQYNVSIGEIGFLDLWQRAGLGIACVSNSSIQAEKQIDRVLDFLEEDGRCEIINIHRELF